MIRIIKFPTFIIIYSYFKPELKNKNKNIIYSTLRNGVIQIEIAGRKTSAILWGWFTFEHTKRNDKLKVILSSAFK